jgi:two-component system alkaline phosphatase synthesis response regulator PhoP
VVARVKALLRRTRLDQLPGATPHVLLCGGLRLDLDEHSLTVQGRPVELTRTEFSLLQIFMENPGYTLTRDDLLEKALGYAYEGMGRALDTHIRNLRRKIEPDADAPIYIQTIYGVGYRLSKDAA